MLRTITTALACAALLGLTTARADDEKKVAGTWAPTEGSYAGQKMSDEMLKPIKLELGDGKYTVTIGENKETGTYKANQKAKPKTLDITPGDGPNAGKAMKAIYELSGDTMKVCYNMAGDKYPKAFESTAENKFVLFVYKRQK